MTEIQTGGDIFSLQCMLFQRRETDVNQALVFYYKITRSHRAKSHSSQLDPTPPNDTFIGMQSDWPF